MPAKFSLDIASNHGDLAAAVEALRRYKEEAKQADKANDGLAQSGAKVRGGLGEVKNKSEEAGAALGSLRRKFIEAGGSAGQFAAGATNSFNQLSDVLVTLAGGMNPITVLIQQGPQLATAFGSVGQTLGVLKNLLNPLTLGLVAAGAAVGYLAYEAYKDAKEIELYNNALGKMGGQAGVSAKQLQQVAKELENATGASGDTVQKALLAAAASSKTADEMRLVAETATNMARATGESADSMADKISRLADDPLKALQELGNQYGILTPQLYEHVKALDDAGDKTEAYKVVLDAVNQKVKQFADDQEKATFSMSRSWDELIKKAREYGLAAAEAGKGSGVTANLTNGTQIPTTQNKTGIAWLDASNEEQAKKNAAMIDNVKQHIAAATQTQTLLTEETRRYAQEQEKATKAAIESDKVQQSLRKGSEKTADIIEEQERRLQAIKAGGNKDEIARAQKTLDLLKQQQAEQEKQEAKKGQNRKAANQAARDAAKNLNEEIGVNVRLLDIQAQIKDLAEGRLKVTNEEKAAAHNRNMVEELSAAQARGLLNDEQKRLLTSMKANQATLDATAAASVQLEIAKERQRLDEKHANAMQAAADLSQTIGMSEKQTNDYLEKQAQIRQRIKDNPLADQGKITADVNAEYDATLEARKAKEADWLGGAKTGFSEWVETADNAAKLVGDGVKGAMDVGTNALVDFVTTGKFSFKSFTTDILKMIAEITVKMALMSAMKAAFGGTSFGASMGFAKGGVFTDPSLKAYSNGVYDKPTPFTFSGRSMFAKGGVFGEAGPEAIMPLSRDSNGRLGVKVQGAEGGGMGGVQIDQINITVSGQDVSATGNSKKQSDMSKAYADAAASGARNEIAEQLKPGGMIYEKMHARS